MERILQLQEIGTAMASLRIRMPQIVVVGSQSSGKSSVLEQLVRREILPRGANLVTRCPIVMHLRRCSSEEHIVFDHLSEPVHDFAAAADIISRRMAETCGTNKGISSMPISLFVNLRDTLEMTLVDLPGLIKVPIGDQPEDIEMQVERMVLDYAACELTVILALVNANADIATNEALKIARKADPQLRRTLGVVTKIDLMDSGTDCMDILGNKHPQLALGYVGVINRGQQDVAGGLSIADSVHREETYFQTSAVYSRLCPRIGSGFLVQRLNEVFCEVVAESLPGLRATVRAQLCDKAQRLQEISPEEALGLQSAALMYHQAVQGIFRHARPGCGLFLRRVSSFLGDIKDLFRSEPVLRFDDILPQLKSSSYLFISEPVFEDVVRDNIEWMKEFYLERADAAVSLLLDEVSSISSPRFAALARRLNAAVCEGIETQRISLDEEIRRYAAIQAAHIDVDRMDFDKARALGVILQGPAKTRLCSLFGRASVEDKRLECDLIRELAASYLAIVGREMRSHVAGAIHYYLRGYIDKHALDAVSGIDAGNMLDEAPETAREREELQREAELLKRMLSVLNGLC